MYVDFAQVNSGLLSQQWEGPELNELHLIAMNFKILLAVRVK